MTQQTRLTTPVRRNDSVRPRNACDDTAARLRAAGRRGASPALVGQALADYWRLVAVTGIDARRALLRALREDIAAGHTTVRACVPVALGDPEFDLVRDATRTCLGGWPASVERRAQVVDEVVDWVVRGLALDSAALVCALLDGADAACLERLARVRSRLDVRTTEAVFAAFRHGAVGAEVAAFLEEWRAAIGRVDSVAA
jgi:hypothetical protein